MRAGLRAATTLADHKAAKRLIKAYADELGVDLCFQNFDREIADLAGTYQTILLAGDAPDPDGCVALKRHDDECCEMKRLYVKPEARGACLGEMLSLAIIGEARAGGYREMVLDTLERLGPAVRIYQRLGFRRCAPYYKNPEPDVIYMVLEL